MRLGFYFVFFLSALSTFCQPKNGIPDGRSATYFSEVPVQWQLASLRSNGLPITDADVDGILYTKLGSSYYKRYFTGWAQASWWGVNTSDRKDDFEKLQMAVDACVREHLGDLQVAAGTLTLSEGIVIRQGALGKSSEYVTLSLHGTGNAYDPAIGGGTLVKILDKNEAAFYIQKGKGCLVENFNFQGQNTGLFNYSMADVVNEKNALITNGVSNARTAPHAGIVIDPFYNANVPVKYAKKQRFYGETYKAGSTQIKINDCYFSSFAVAICISPAGLQNGENIFITNPFIANCSTGISTGEIQNRTVKIFNYTGWGNILYHFNSYYYSAGSGGCPPSVHGFNIAGVTKWLYRTGAWYGNTFFIEDGHAEQLYGFGGCWDQRSTTFIMDNGRIFLLGSDKEKDSLIRLPNQLLQCDLAHIDNSMISYYGKPSAYLGMSCSNIKVSNSSLSAPILASSGVLKYDMTLFEPLGDLMDERVNEVTTSRQASKVTGISEATNTWTFVDNTGKVYPGQYVQLFPKNERQMKGNFNYGNPLFIGGGTVLSVNENTRVVTVKGIPLQLAPGMILDINTTSYQRKKP